MQLQIILVSDDPQYSYTVLNDLTAMKRTVGVAELGWTDRLSFDVELALAKGRYKVPTILMLDCAFSALGNEAILERVASLKSSMPIECLVLRPAADDGAAERLRRLGVLVYEDEIAPPAVSLSAEAAIH